MFNPPPGPEYRGIRCKKQPIRQVYDVPLGGDPNQHAHINPHGITYQCDGELEVKK